MKHYKIGNNHIFEFGIMSIKRIKLTRHQYNEMYNHFLIVSKKNKPIDSKKKDKSKK